MYHAGFGIASHRVQHETEITQRLLGFETDRYNRQNVPFEADAELWIGDEYFLLENERGTNNQAEIIRRSLKLATSSACIL